MKSGALHAWHYSTGRPVQVTWAEGQITAITHVQEEPTEEVWVAPSLIDLQINGYAGVDFQQDDLTAAQLLQGVRGLRRDGCARLFFTLITAEWPTLIHRLRQAVALRAQSVELQSAIEGWHIEGPFLSDQPGFHGAHNPAWMLDPNGEHIRELRALTDGQPLLVTIAPERRGAIEAIRLARSLGIAVSLGHTNASIGQLQEAIEAGATGFTHLANACPRELDRHDNILWRVADLPGLAHVSLIPDGHHVSPMLFRLLHRHLTGSGRSVYFTTDAMAAAGAPPGRYRLGALNLDVGPDQIVREPGKTNFSGSALRPIEGVARAAAMLGATWQTCWEHFSSAPAKFVGIEIGFEVGAPATFCCIKPSAGSLDVNWCWEGNLFRPPQTRSQAAPWPERFF